MISVSTRGANATSRKSAVGPFTGKAGVGKSGAIAFETAARARLPAIVSAAPTKIASHALRGSRSGEGRNFRKLSSNSRAGGWIVATD